MTKYLFVSEGHGPGKLVRDGVGREINARGGNAIVNLLPTNERLPALRMKALEEAEEIRTAGSQKALTRELGDLYDVLRAIAGESGIAWADVLMASSGVLASRGGFTMGLFLREEFIPERTEVPEPTYPADDYVSEAELERLKREGVTRETMAAGNNYAEPRKK